jgi:hypothetical protein
MPGPMLKPVGIAVLGLTIAFGRPASAQELVLPVPPAVIYDAESKSAAAAFILELFLPGAGSVYASDISGAVTTWMLFGAGVVAMAWGAEHAARNDAGQSAGSFEEQALTAGVLIFLGGRLYGLVNSISATSRYNDGLRARLGMGESVAMTPFIAPNSGGLAIAGRF